MNIVKMKPNSLKSHPSINEKMIQDFICDDPSVLGLGDVYVKDKERIQSKGGRLDLLLADNEEEIRYEVEIQLGKTDESHIIRTIEYWDLEKNKFPKYEHRAVIVAEEITSRFFNVLQILNKNLPIIAIQVQAYDLSGQVGLSFTKILDLTEIGEDETTGAIFESTDRSYWEDRGSKESVKLVDKIIDIINKIQIGFEASYNKHYIGLFKQGRAFNFAIFKAKRKWIRIELSITKDADLLQEIEDAGLEILQYNERSKRLYLKLDSNQIDQKNDLLTKILKFSLDEWNG